MTTLFRPDATLSLPTIFWEASQVFARQEGWRPSGETGGGENGSGEGRAPGRYAAGRVVGEREAAELAAALVRVVNGRAGDSGDLDLDSLVGLVNFLRAGSFGIR